MALAKLLEAKTFTLHNGLKMENGVLVSQLPKKAKINIFSNFFSTSLTDHFVAIPFEKTSKKNYF